MLKLVFFFFLIFCSQNILSVVFGLTLTLFIFFNFSVINTSKGIMFLSFVFDSVSVNLVYLTLWISILSILASFSIFKSNNHKKMFLFFFSLLVFTLILSLLTSSVIMFYILFEFSLLPMLLVILGWGYQPERVQAGVYMFMYTLSASLPLLMSIVFFVYSVKVFNFLTLKELNPKEFLNYFWLFFFFFAFLVKFPIYFIHLWLPKAHVEAPVSGSMILAGVLLKLGGYGVLRLMVMFQLLIFKMSFLFFSVSLTGGVIVSLITLRQTDMKALVAYSSVSHMSLVLGGLISVSEWGLKGSMMLMVGHGLCSSGMFLIVNLSYFLSNSRSFYVNKGMISNYPSITLFWFIMTMGMMAAPPSLNLFSEISIIISMFCVSTSSLILISIMSFSTVAYMIYLYVSVQHGKTLKTVLNGENVTVVDFLLLSLHLFPLNIFFMVSFLF